MDASRSLPVVYVFEKPQSHDIEFKIKRAKGAFEFRVLGAWFLITSNTPAGSMSDHPIVMQAMCQGLKMLILGRF